MSLAVPLGLAAAALAVPLTLWYVLRSRRPRVTVAATYLWARADRSVQAAVPWQRFRPDRTFWLVALALAAGALALARPAVPVEAELGDHTIVVVDVSASMLAEEDGDTRLELARARARELAGAMGPGQTMSLVEAGTRARTLQSASPDARALRAAVDELRPVHGSSDLADALTLAASLHRPGEVTTTTLLTDGVVPDDAAALAPEGLRVEAFGSDRPNLAVTRLQVVPAGGARADAFVQVRNYGQIATRARVVLSAAGEPAVEETVSLAPRGTEDLVLRLPHHGETLVEAVVEPAGVTPTGEPATDALAVDDRAYAVLADRGELVALVAGPGNVFVEGALAAVEGVTVRTAPGLPEDVSDVDLVVVDRIPAPPTPSVPTIYVAPDPAPEGVDAGGTVEAPAITFADGGHDLLAGVDLSDVAVAGAQRVEAPGLAPLAGGPDGPLLLAGDLGGTPVVYLPFALADSTLPLEVAWPVLVSNAVGWLVTSPAETPLVAGTEARLPVPAGAATADATAPDGTVHTVDPARPRLLVDQVGVWEVAVEDAAGGGAVTRLAVNAPPGEGDLARARPDPARAAREAREAGEEPVPAAQQGRRLFGPGILAVVLALLLAEWASAHGVHPLRSARRWLGGRRQQRVEGALR